MKSHLLNRHVEHQLGLGHPIVPISSAQSRNPNWVPGWYSLMRVWLPDNLILVQTIKLRREGRVAAPHLAMRKLSLYIDNK